jgi:hypothetical protein
VLHLGPLKIICADGDRPTMRGRRGRGRRECYVSCGNIRVRQKEMAGVRGIWCEQCWYDFITKTELLAFLLPPRVVAVYGLAYHAIQSEKCGIV